MAIVTFKDGAIYLHTLMSKVVFYKTGSSKRMRDGGLFAKRTDDDWRISRWNFEETLTSELVDNGERDTVWLRGMLDMKEPQTLHDALNGPHAMEAMRLYCDFTASNSVKEAQGLGAGGIIVNGDFDEILFLPRELYRTSVYERSLREATEEHGQYLNRALAGDSGVRFMQAVVIYKAMSGMYPFTAEDEEARQNDIRDSNYLPLRFVCPTANLKMDLFVRLALKGRNIIVDTEKFSALLAAMVSQSAEAITYTMRAAPLIASGGQVPAMQGVTGAMSIGGPPGLSPDFLSRKERFVRFTQTRVRLTRWLRFHTVLIGTAVLCFAAVFGIALYFYNASLKVRTTMGLNHMEAAQAFYSAQNLLDPDAIRACISRRLSSVANGFAMTFVGGRVSAMSNPTESYLPPALWVAFGRTSHNVYGLSQFTIDNTERSVFLRGPKRGERTPPLLKEDGVALHNGDQKELLARYYLWYSVGGRTLFVIRTSQAVTLTYRRNRWIITDIEDMGRFEDQVRKYDFDVFRADYLNALKDSTPEGMKAGLDELRKTYDFLPTETEISEGLSYYYETYYNSRALLR